MKTSTIVLISLTVAGLLSAFLYPISLLLSSKGDGNPFNLSKTPETIDMPMFSDLVIDRTDTARVYLSFNFTIEASDTVTTPSITLNEGWGKWLTLDSDGETLRMVIAIPDSIDTGEPYYIYRYCEINATMRIPSNCLRSLSSFRTNGNLRLAGVKVPSLALRNGVRKIDFDNCAIADVLIDKDGCPNEINLHATRINSLACNISDNTYTNISCSDDAAVSSLTAISTDSYSREIDLSNAKVDTLLINPDASGGPINILGLRTAFIR